MASTKLFVVSLLFALIFALTATISSADLSPEFYAYSCPEAVPAIKRVIKDAVMKEPRMGASLLRLHFHDCFVKVSCFRQKKKMYYELKNVDLVNMGYY